MNLIQGANLTKGLRVSLVSGLAGIAGAAESSRRYIVTDRLHKKNPLLADIDTGATTAASPLSVWQVLP